MPRDAPPPLTVAAVLVGIQGVGLVVLAVVEAFSVDTGRVTLGVTTAAFFLLYGGLLIMAALALGQRRGWPRGPVLITQLIELGLAWNLRDLLPAALVLALVAAGVIAGVLHPASMDALDRRPED